jgi:hypothetical protein
LLIINLQLDGALHSAPPHCHTPARPKSRKNLHPIAGRWQSGNFM